MTGLRYIADSPESIRTVELDGLVALFHRPSGMTHILAPPAPQILEVLAGNSGDAVDIADRISARFQLEADDVHAAIGARLAELEAAGLVLRG
ncbi:HPr-rel-A system PqqD family peptide chaperone [Sphingosinicella rhizophila]|uniref:HPr-rel-A system PqqD family peptide chaperone n=1 Tax=Sphingosinicella rhizophila TaxID=3050082 RepID=A0ABU3Q4U0_9SPHN|nr:HPr-rel-A system PqqD family peptide chaperone [Sphingosinicella sp. GR2756]MDT9598434.1 HPr-rel-A system PqqD family peptide chaperone [Sphingosinicella sp. GR2756]